jgi:hypothetical protein
MISLSSLNLSIDRETRPDKKYWLKQARMHFRSSITHRKKGEAIMNKLASYLPGDFLSVGGSK